MRVSPVACRGTATTRSMTTMPASSSRYRTAGAMPRSDAMRRHVSGAPWLAA